MKKTIIIGALSLAMSTVVVAQTYDSTTKVDTNNTSTSTSTVTSTNTNNNNNTSTSTSTNTNNNNNVNTSTSTSTNTNTNINSGDMTVRNINTGDMTNRNINTTTSNNTNTNTNINTGDMTNRNINTSTSTATSTSTNTNVNQNINTGDMTNRNISTSNSTNVNQNIQSGEMTNRNINESRMKVEQPPPTAIAPAMMSGGGADLCTTGVSGAAQTQIFGIAFGGTVRDKNCERLKLSKTLFDMGMKVAAVATMCQDRRVWDAMMAAGTPCPYEGLIGAQAKAAWEANPDRIPKLDDRG